jgi:hypothetical protein
VEGFFEKMVCRACLQMTPVQLNLQHVSCVTLIFPKMFHKSSDLMNTLLNEYIMKAETTHLYWAVYDFLW